RASSSAPRAAVCSGVRFMASPSCCQWSEVEGEIRAGAADAELDTLAWLARDLAGEDVLDGAAPLDARARVADAHSAAVARLQACLLGGEKQRCSGGRGEQSF